MSAYAVHVLRGPRVPASISLPEASMITATNHIVNWHVTCSMHETCLGTGGTLEPDTIRSLPTIRIQQPD
jgi:hypothetical protein